MYYPHLPTSKPTSLYYRLPAKRSFRDLYFWRNNEQQMMTAFVRLRCLPQRLRSSPRSPLLVVGLCRGRASASTRIHEGNYPSRQIGRPTLRGSFPRFVHTQLDTLPHSESLYSHSLLPLCARRASG